MTEMVERVARAIYEARWGGGNWDVLKEQRHAEFELAKWMPMARAAIEAMREPTEAMTFSGDFARDDYGSANYIWRAMIDEALK